jgi:hypothetical protein
MSLRASRIQRMLAGAGSGEGGSMIKLVRGALAAALVLAPVPALAWGQIGHRVTGAIAEDHLSPRARREVRRLLGRESLAEASTWPDEMRPETTPFWQTEAGPYHFTDVPTGKTYAQVGAPPQGNAVTGLARFTATLRDPTASVEDKRLALRFIVHIVGDLHQPLHVGNGLDRGGNDVQVILRGEAQSLHLLWDTGLIEHQKLSFTEMVAWLRPGITPELARAWREPDPLVWIAEGQALRDGVYPQGPEITPLYVLRHWPTAKLRLQQGGVRIAAYLDWVFAAR